MLLGTVLLWALNITVTKYMLEHGWLPLAYGTIRYFAAIRSSGSSPPARALVPDRARATEATSLLAALMIFLNQVCFVYGVEFATPRRWRSCSARRRSSSG